MDTASCCPQHPNCPAADGAQRVQLVNQAHCRTNVHLPYEHLPFQLKHFSTSGSNPPLSMNNLARPDFSGMPASARSIMVAQSI
jgi:hypothetical protein